MSYLSIYLSIYVFIYKDNIYVYKFICNNWNFWPSLRIFVCSKPPIWLFLSFPTRAQNNISEYLVE